MRRHRWCWLYLRLQRINFLGAADAAAPALAIGYSLGRIGCFLVGDDYGRPTTSWVGIAFPKGSPPTTAEELRNFGASVDPSLPPDAILRVHPTQLYESAAALLKIGRASCRERVAWAVVGGGGEEEK